MTEPIPDAPSHWNNSEAAAWQSGYEAGRRSLDGLRQELVEVLVLIRTGATNEQLDYRLRTVLATTGTALVDRR